MSKKSEKQVRRKLHHVFRRNAISIVEDQYDMTAQAARELGINQNLLRTWHKKYGKGTDSSGLSENEQEELNRQWKDVGRTVKNSANLYLQKYPELEYLLILPSRSLL